MIYLHLISDIRILGASMKNLRMFRKICGAENMRKVWLFITMWDKATPDEGSARERELRRNFWASLLADRSYMTRNDRDNIDSARYVVCHLLDNKPTTIKMQDEMISSKTLIQTDAGNFINQEILKLTNKYEEQRQILMKEMSSEMAQSMCVQPQLASFLPLIDHQKTKNSGHNSKPSIEEIVSQIKQQREERYKLAQAPLTTLERRSRWQDEAKKREQVERELRASADRDRKPRIIAGKQHGQAEQALAEMERERVERASQSAKEREEVEQESRERQRFDPVRQRGGYEERSRQREAYRSQPNTVKSRPNDARASYGPRFYEHGGQPYKKFLCCVPACKTFGSSECGKLFDVVNHVQGKFQ